MAGKFKIKYSASWVYLKQIQRKEKLKYKSREQAHSLLEQTQNKWVSIISSACKMGPQKGEFILSRRDEIARYEMVLAGENF